MGSFVTPHEPQVVEGLASRDTVDGQGEVLLVSEGQVLARIQHATAHAREAGGVVLLQSPEAIRAIAEGDRIRVVLSARRILNLTSGHSFAFARP